MQTLRSTIKRAPHRLNAHRLNAHRTNLHHFSHTAQTMSLFPRFTQEFAPLFRLFDEYDRQAFSGLDRHGLQSVRSFTPKFDVRETKEAYELHGELPGVDQKDVSVEWTDSSTLTVSGRHEVVREEGERPQQLGIEGNTDKNGEGQAGQKGIESKAYQPAVEDETPQLSSSTSTPSATATTDNQIPSEGESQLAHRTENRITKDQKAKYWVSERSVGEFHRSFAFPARVDQEGVKASLKNGILSIVVPKVVAPVKRKVNIE